MAPGYHDPMQPADAKRILEAALLCAAEPPSLSALRALFNDELDADRIRSLLVELERDCLNRGIELVPVASGWRYQSRLEMRVYLDRLNRPKPPHGTRAVWDTLAIIAYRQPVARGGIEALRGVAVSTLGLRQLGDRGWIEGVGERETPGHPRLYATTPQFLDDFGFSSLDPLSGSGRSQRRSGTGATAASGSSRSDAGARSRCRSDAGRTSGCTRLGPSSAMNRPAASFIFTENPGSPSSPPTAPAAASDPPAAARSGF